MILLFLALLILNIFITYILANGDYMAPPFLVAITTFISVLFAWYMKDIWQVSYLPLTVIIIMVGIYSFTIAYFGVASLFNKEKPGCSYRGNITYIPIKKWKIIVYFIIALFFCVLFYNAVVLNVGSTGGWMEIMARYRYATAYQNITGKGISIPSYISFGQLVVSASSYVWGYVCINNYIVKKKWDILLLIATIVGIMTSMIAASRFDLIRLPIAAIIIYYALKARNGELTQNKKMKLLFKYIVIAIVIVVLFSLFRSVVGRTDSSGFLGYLAGYIGAPSVLFNEFLKTPLHESALFGKETFWGIYNIIGKITGNASYLYDYTLEFRVINGKPIGNVYTAFRLYYADFGMIGVIVLSFIQGLILGLMYQMTRRNIHIKFGFGTKKRSVVDFKLLVYAMIAHSFILMFYADWFYSQILSWLQIKTFICIWIIKVVIVDWNYKSDSKIMRKKKIEE